MSDRSSLTPPAGVAAGAGTGVVAGTAAGAGVVAGAGFLPAPERKEASGRLLATAVFRLLALFALTLASATCFLTFLNNAVISVVLPPATARAVAIAKSFSTPFWMSLL